MKKLKNKDEIISWLEKFNIKNYGLDHNIQGFELMFLTM